MQDPSSARYERDPSPLTTLLVTVPVALLIAFEEWGWDPLSRLMAQLARLRWIARFEHWVAALPPYGALVLFAVPCALLLPLKIFALWMIASGQMLLGVAIIGAAKVAGTAILARLFTLAQPALMRLPWFAHLYLRWTAWKNALLLRVRGSEPWRRGRVIALGARRVWDAWRALLWA